MRKVLGLILGCSFVSVAFASDPFFPANSGDPALAGSRTSLGRLTPLIGKASGEENEEVYAALLKFSETGSVASLENYLKTYPEGRWAASVHLAVGKKLYTKALFTDALTHFEDAWRLAKSGQTDIQSADLRNRIGIEVGTMNAKLGRRERVQAIVAELLKLNLVGAQHEQLFSLQEALWMLCQRPDQAYLCGPAAVANVLRASEPQLNTKQDESISSAKSTEKGTSLSANLKLARKCGLDFVAAFRKPGTPIPVPAVVHWKSGHYAAITEQVGSKFIVKDPTFNSTLSVPSESFDEEASGYFLISKSLAEKEGWREVSDEEALTVYGKGQTYSKNPNRTGPHEVTCKDCPANSGMAVYNIQAMLVGVTIFDTPVGYTPPYGPDMHFTATYSQRNSWSSGVAVPNLGPQWTFNWFSTLYDVDLQISNSAKVFERGGGIREYSYDLSYNAYMPNYMTLNRLVNNNGTWEVQHCDGSKEVYGLVVSSSQYFLTKVYDKFGNFVTLEYDSTNRLTTVRDGLNQTLTFAYENATSYKIARVTDAFGRFAKFDYNPSGYLGKITDAVGIESQFIYGSGTYISDLITPYGKTSFVSTDTASPSNPTATRELVVTDPKGGKERVLFMDNAPGFFVGSTAEPFNTVPYSYGNWNNTQYRNTFFWDKKAMAEMGTTVDYYRAHVYHFLHDLTQSACSGILQSEKIPGQSRICYLYEGNEVNGDSISQTAKYHNPSEIWRSLDTTSPKQLEKFKYNAVGNLTFHTDPRNRQTRYGYEPNGVDVNLIEQLNGSTWETVRSLTWNANHRPLTITDAAGQTTHFTWTAHGQLLTVTNPKGEITTFNYDAPGYLRSIDGALAGIADLVSIDYDACGRAFLITQPDSYFEKHYYDDLDRLTKVEYPDSTSDQLFYTLLDVTKTINRRNFETNYHYDALRNLDWMDDAEGNHTSFDWCICGGLGSMTDGNGHTTTWHHNDAGQVTEKLFDDGSDISYGFDLSGRLATITDAAHQVKTMTYYPDDTVWTETYSNLAVGTTATPSRTYTYDTVYPWLKTVASNGETLTLDYYPVGQLGALSLKSVTPSGGGGTLTYGYDELGRQVNRKVDGVANEQSLNFDALGRLGSMTNLLGTFNYAYEGTTARLATIKKGTTTLTSLGYYGGTADRRLQSLSSRKTNGATWQDEAYEYNAGGDITKWTSTIAGVGTPNVRQFGYDDTDQLTSATATAGSISDSYDYDGGGNRTTVNGSTYIFNNLNQYLSQSIQVPVSGTTTVPASVKVNGVSTNTGFSPTFSATIPGVYGPQNLTVEATTANGSLRTTHFVASPVGMYSGYDPNGNLLRDGNRFYEWDAENQLRAISYAAGGRTEFTYDPLGRRTKIIEKDAALIVTSTQRYVWDGLQIAEQRDAAGTTVQKRYFDQGVIQAGASYTYAEDPHGSITGLSDSTGAERGRWSFSAWGTRNANAVTANAQDSDFAYTGHLLHARSGLLLAPYRAYDPLNARWTSRDPLNMAELTQGVNLYSYVNNMPTGLVDPLGLSARDVQRINDIMNQEVLGMVKNHERYPGTGNLNAVRNNIEGLLQSLGIPIGPSYKPCGQQADNVLDALNEAKKLKQFDADWNFDEYRVGILGGYEPGFGKTGAHTWVQGDSSDALDPHLTIDPWRGEVRNREIQWRR